ncbi:hypothetical protein ABFS82_11G037800 [Erythranthe guttata]|uniref:Uncharacterized protein n=1 Tax=Erythranthe guttata TaxID=4155 RepID=A0A022R7R2_ERYGU|nr:hypothetical protein MIMGU_mgv1a020655mg [Erythranthe guttata]
MATGAADLMFRCVFDGSLSMGDMDIERRPYHRDCKCALHETKGTCSHSNGNISFPKREFKSKCSLSLSSSNISFQSSYLHISKKIDSSCSIVQCQNSADRKPV